MLLARLALLTASLVVATCLAEIVIRLVPNVPVRTVASQSDPTLGEVYLPGQHARYSSREFDHVVSINAHGWHDIDHTWEKPAGVFRILLLGDSYVEALQVPVEQIFYRRLERRLNETPASDTRRFETIGLARSGWGTAQQLVALETIGLRYRPDLVILCFLPDNDFSDSLRALARYPYMPYVELGDDGSLRSIPATPARFRDDWKYHLYKHSQLACFLVQNFEAFKHTRQPPREVPLRYQIFMEDKPAPWDTAIETTLACMRRMNDLCRQRGIDFVCISLTSAVSLGQIDLQAQAARYPAMRDHRFDPQWPYRLLADRLQGSIRYTSMLPAFQRHMAETGRPLHFARDGHWTEPGHALAADFLYDYLTTNDLLTP